jgi:membrane-bound ClpP family serine protease
MNWKKIYVGIAIIFLLILGLLSAIDYEWAGWILIIIGIGFILFLAFLAISFIIEGIKE